MALTHERAKEVAEHCESLCNEAKALHYRILEFLGSNSNLSIDWAAGSKPNYINEDAGGNLDGLKFSRQQVANAIGSLDQVRALLANNTVTQGDHLGNINQLAKSDV
jgi:hypothetical protein